MLKSCGVKSHVKRSILVSFLRFLHLAQVSSSSRILSYRSEMQMHILFSVLSFVEMVFSNLTSTSTLVHPYGVIGLFIHQYYHSVSSVGLFRLQGNPFIHPFIHCCAHCESSSLPSPWQPYDKTNYSPAFKPYLKKISAIQKTTLNWNILRSLPLFNALIFVLWKFRCLESIQLISGK